MKNQPIREFMTANPTCIQSKQTVMEAHRLMQLISARHLPVLDGARLVGIVTQKGLYRLETMVNVDRANDPILDALEVPFLVPPEEPVGEVAGEMARRKVRAAIVVEGDKVAGIFTTTDALRVLAIRRAA